MRRALLVLLGTLALAGCTDQRAPLIGDEDAGAGVYGVVVLSEAFLPVLTHAPDCAAEPAFVLNAVQLGAVFGDFPPTDNTRCPQGADCCFSPTDFAYAAGGTALTDGPITIAVSVTGDDSVVTNGVVQLLPVEDAYPPPGSDSPTERGLSFPPSNTHYSAASVTISDEAGTATWSSGAETVPSLPWSTQICGEYSAPLPMPRTAWTVSWSPDLALDRVLLRMRYTTADRDAGGYVLCAVQADAGSLTVPDAIMSALPPQGFTSPVLIGERDVLIPLNDRGYVQVVLQDAVLLSDNALPLGD